MARLKEVDIYYRLNSNKTLTISVENVENAEYKWQCCKPETADWIEVSFGSGNYYTTESIDYIKEHKFRCLILINNKVRYYSKVATIGVNVAKEYYSPKYEHSYNYSYTHQRSEYSYDVSDTDYMDGLEFENYCSDVLKHIGYTDVQTTQGSGDYGIDLLAKKENITYAIQCKCYSSAVGNKAVQEAYSGKSFYNCMLAVVLTNNYFTQAAIETAKKNNVILWDRDILNKMIKEAYQAKANKEDNHQHQKESSNNNQTDFFKGCKTKEEVKTRYKLLMKTYHPDSPSGDTEMAQIINAQYDEIMKKFN